MKYSIFLTTTLALGACATQNAPVASSQPAAAARTPAAVYTFESDANGFNTKTHFYDNGEEVVAFDAQFTPALAQAALDFLRTKTQNPVTYLVVTHPNPDKFNGMGVFQAAGARVVVSRKTEENLQAVHAYKKYFFVNMAKMFTEETYPALGKPDEIFEGKKSKLTLKDGEQIELFETALPGVSSNQTFAYIPKAKALFVGDLVHNKAHAWLEGGLVRGLPKPNIASWKKSLSAMAANYPADTTVYGGRGEAVKVKLAAEEQSRYLTKAEQVTRAYVKKIGKHKAFLMTPVLADHMLPLTKDFEAAFPDHQLSYMIQYGAGPFLKQSAGY